MSKHITKIEENDLYYYIHLKGGSIYLRKKYPTDATEHFRDYEEMITMLCDYNKKNGKVIPTKGNANEE